MRVIPMAAITLLLMTSCWACPFCSPVEADLFSEVQDAQAIVLVSKVDGQKYKITQVWKGGATLGKIVLAAEPRGKATAGGSLLLTTAAPVNLPYWSDAPRYLNVQELAFAKQAMAISKAGDVKKWDFAVNYLENPSTEIANSAYSLLSTAPLSQVQKRATAVGVSKLLGWVRNAQVPEQRRALYLLMAYPSLTAQDIPWLKNALFSPKLSPMSPLLGPYIVAYLQASGTAAVAQVEKRFLSANQPATRTLSVTRALALFGQRTNSAAMKSAIIELFLREAHHPERGPFAVAPLAVWKDFRAAPAVEKLAKNNPNVTWIKVAAIRYFRSFSSAEAQKALERLSQTEGALVSRTTDAYQISDLGIE